MGPRQAGTDDGHDRFRARRRLHRVLICAVAVLASLLTGDVFAHWESEAAGSMEAATGDVALQVDGDLAFDSPECSSGVESGSCDKFDSDVIGTVPLSASTGGASFTITGWVHKPGESSEAVGFYYTVIGGTVDIVVKSGVTYREASLEEGSGLWLNPACEGDPGPGGAVKCSPKNTKAISYVAFCIHETSPAVCPPMIHSLVVTNVGSIPTLVELWLVDATGHNYCEVLDLTVHRVVGGTSSDPPLYQGPLCGLVGTALQIEAQLDPGDSAEYEVTLTFSDPTSGLNGTDGGFTARFEATQWNDPGGWTDRVDVPLTISVTGDSADGERSTPGPDSEDAVVEEPDSDPPSEEPAAGPPAEGPPDEPSNEAPSTEESPAEDAGLTGIVWLDEGADGVRTATEPRLSQIVVRLLSEGLEVAATTTDADGSYSFSGLPDGVYTLRVEAPPGHLFTSSGQGGDPALDSDVATSAQVDDRYLGRIDVSLSAGVATGVGDAGLVVDGIGGS